MKKGANLSRYRLIEEIGAGGMGVVWKAEDTVLNRVVAIKVLPTDVSRDEKRRAMFRDEARLAGKVSSANIVQVYELGREGDLDYIVMEHVEGKPLRRILHGRPLPLDKVAAIGLQVAQALARAHRKNLLHRDLKPANVLMTPEGDVKVADFGLATLFDRQPSDAGAAETTRSIDDGPADPSPLDTHQHRSRRVGTLQYMSPEQAQGTDLDPRSDIFSLGIMLYEMTTGQRPFRGATREELLQNIVDARPRAVHELVPDVPLELDRIIQKTLAKRPKDRYQTMDDLAVDLNHLARNLDSGSAPTWKEIGTPIPPKPRIWAWLSLALVMIVAAVAIWEVFRDHRIEENALLIVPFEVRGNPADTAQFAGLVVKESLETDLAGAKGLKVLPGPTEASTNGLDLARRAGAGRLVSGSLTWEGSEVVLHVKLFDTTDKTILWATRMSSDGGGLSAVVSAVTPQIASALGIQLPKRYEYFADFRGSDRMGDSEDLALAIGAFRRNDLPRMLEATSRLVQEFPNEPEAWALRSYALARQWWDDRLESTKASVDRALAILDGIDPHNPWTACLVAWRKEGERDFAAAATLYSRLLERTDTSPYLRAWVYRRRAWQNNVVGNHAAAIEDATRARELDLSDGASYQRLASVLRSAGKTEESRNVAVQAVAVSPGDYYSWFILALAYGSLDLWDEAADAAEKACSLSQSAAVCGNYAITLVQVGRADEAAKEANHVLQLEPSTYGYYNLACYRALAGDKRGALRDLQNALDQGYASLEIRNDRALLSLHDTPEFQAIVDEVEKRTKQQ